MIELVLATSLAVFAVVLVAPEAQSAMLGRRLFQIEEKVKTMPVVGRTPINTMMNKQGGGEDVGGSPINFDKPRSTRR